jgi:hypothetical protein
LTPEEIVYAWHKGSPSRNDDAEEVHAVQDLVCGIGVVSEKMIGRAEYQAEICAKNVEQGYDVIGSPYENAKKGNGC